MGDVGDVVDVVDVGDVVDVRMTFAHTLLTSLTPAFPFRNAIIRAL